MALMAKAHRRSLEMLRDAAAVDGVSMTSAELRRAAKLAYLRSMGI